MKTSKLLINILCSFFLSLTLSSCITNNLSDSNSDNSIDDGNDVDTEGLDFALLQDGSTYEGNFKKGKFNGTGRLTASDGSTYEGEWEDNKKNGYGIMKSLDGHCYTGQFKDGKIHGHGKYVWPNGDEYEGDYVEDLRHGFGKYSSPLGYSYEGEWEDDMKHGKGIYKSPYRNNGNYLTIKEAIFDKDILVKELKVIGYEDLTVEETGEVEFEDDSLQVVSEDPSLFKKGAIVEDDDNDDTIEDDLTDNTTIFDEMQGDLIDYSDIINILNDEVVYAEEAEIKSYDVKTKTLDESCKNYSGFYDKIGVLYQMGDLKGLALEFENVLHFNKDKVFEYIYPIFVGAWQEVYSLKETIQKCLNSHFLDVKDYSMGPLINFLYYLYLLENDEKWLHYYTVLLSDSTEKLYFKRIECKNEKDDDYYLLESDFAEELEDLLKQGFLMGQDGKMFLPN